MTEVPVRPVQRALDAIGLSLTVCGETLTGLLAPSWMLGPFGVFFAAGVIVLVIRHAVWFRPHLGTRIHRAATSQPAIRDAVPVALATRMGILVIGFVAATQVGYTLQPGEPRLARHELLNTPARFDAGWYMGIARRGYEWREDLRGRQQPIAFFPAYPVSVRVAGDLVTVPAKLFRWPGFLENGNTRVLWGGVLATVTFVLLAVPRMVRLIHHETGDLAVSRWVVVFAMTWPFALFFSAVYSEGLFLLALAGTLLSWREERWRHAAAWGLLAGLTRSNGWTLSLALLADCACTAGRRTTARLLVACAPLLGAAAFSIYIWNLTGHPLEWMRAQEGWGREVNFASFVLRRWDAINNLGLVEYVRRDPSDLAAAIAAMAMVGAGGWFAKRRRWLYAVLLPAYLLPALAVDLPAVGRMTSVLFPGFLVLTHMVSRRWWLPAAAAFALIQSGLAVLHYTWRPPY